MTRESTDGNTDAQRSAKPATQQHRNSKPTERQQADSAASKSKKDPLNSEETLRRNENGNS